MVAVAAVAAVAWRLNGGSGTRLLCRYTARVTLVLLQQICVTHAHGAPLIPIIYGTRKLHPGTVVPCLRAVPLCTRRAPAAMAATLHRS